MTSNPDAPNDSGAPFAVTIDEIVGKLEAYTYDRIQNKSFLGPVPTRLHLTVRPLGSHMTMQREIPIDTGRKQHQFPSQWVRDELRKIFGSAEKMSAKKRTLSVEVVSEFGVKIIDIRINTAAKVKIALSAKANDISVSAAEPAAMAEPDASPEPVSTPAPTSEPVPAPASDPAITPEPTHAPPPQPQPTPEPAASEPEGIPQNDTAPEAEQPPKANGEGNPELIDFGTMKYFPTDMTHKVVKKTLLTAGITTKQQLLDLLGTTEPTRIEWEIFIKKLSKIAKDAGFKFFSSSDGTLYWWLTKRAKWIKPFTGNS